MTAPLYNEFYLEEIKPETLDELLENGFRHFGEYFFRYSHNRMDGQIVHVIPLRIDLKKFTKTKSQKKIWQKNADTEFKFQEIQINETKIELFRIHAERFESNRPSSVFDFLSKNAPFRPCYSEECCVYIDGKLAAVSFLDIGNTSTSSVYGMFDPDLSKRSLGIYTMLLEIEYSIQMKKDYYYPGYAYIETSFYDYKKNFNGLEYLDWNKGWKPFIKTH